MPDLKRIAAIHDLSGLGKCSLTVALPVISASGVECSCIPTALLSTHTGEFADWTIKDLTDQMLPIAEHWRSVGARFDGIYTGYLTSPAQEALMEDIIAAIAGPDTLILCDPVMADNGEYYANFGDEMCEAFRRLCSRAHIITPNVTEAAFLCGIEYRPAPHSREYIDSLLYKLAEFGSKIIVITGVHLADGEIGSVIFNPATGWEHAVMYPVRGGVFYGTGDIFASALAALIVRGAPLQTAHEAACELVRDSIDRSCKRKTPRRFGVDFEGALPAYIKRVEQIEFK